MTTGSGGSDDVLRPVTGSVPQPKINVLCWSVHYGLDTGLNLLKQNVTNL